MSQVSKSCYFAFLLHPRGGKHFLVPLDRHNSIFYENSNFDFHLFIVTMTMHFIHHMLFNPNQTGGGGGWNPPPSTFRAIISRNFFPAHRAFTTFFFRVLRNFWCYFRKNRAYCSEVMQRYVIERRLKIWEFSGYVYKTYGKWLFVLKIHFGL